MVRSIVLSIVLLLLDWNRSSRTDLIRPRVT